MNLGDVVIDACIYIYIRLKRQEFENGRGFEGSVEIS